MKKVVKRLLNFFGFDLVRYDVKNKFSQSYIKYDLEEESKPYIKQIRNYTMLTFPRLVSLFSQVVHCEKNEIEGAFVECGVWKGGAVGLMVLANLNYSSKRRHMYLFDAFDDICEPDQSIDGERAIRDVKKYGGESAGIEGNLKSIKGIYDSFGGPGLLEENQNLLERELKYPKDYLHYFKGWFEDTIPENANNIDKIAILRLDGDWYSSTKVCLDHLFDKVVKGGFVIIDDYGHYEGCKKAVDEFLVAHGLNEYLNHVDYSCRYWLKA